MIVEVVFLNSYVENNHKWTYLVSAQDYQKIHFSAIVKVPFNHQELYAIVINKKDTTNFNIDKLKYINEVVLTRSLNQYQYLLYKQIKEHSFVAQHQIFEQFLSKNLIKELIDIKKLVTKNGIDAVIKRKQNIKIVDKDPKFKLNTDCQNYIINSLSMNKLVDRLQESITGQILIICPNQEMVDKLYYEIKLHAKANVVKYAGNNKQKALGYYLVKSDIAQIVIGDINAMFLPFNYLTSVIVYHPEAINYLYRNELFTHINQLLYSLNNINLVEVRNIPYLNQECFNKNACINYQLMINNDILNNNTIDQVLNDLQHGHVMIYLPISNEQAYRICPECFLIQSTKQCRNCQCQTNVLENNSKEHIIDLFSRYITNITTDASHIKDDNKYLIVTQNIPYDQNLSIEQIYTVNLLGHLQGANLEKIYYYYGSLLNLSMLSNKPLILLESQEVRSLNRLFSQNLAQVHDQLKHKLNAYTKNEVVAVMYITQKTFQHAAYQMNKIVKELKQHQINVIFNDKHPYQKYRIWRYEARIAFTFSNLYQLQNLYQLYQNKIKIIYL